jgi:hypothetical protein
VSDQQQLDIDQQSEFEAGPAPQRAGRRGLRNGTRESTRESIRSGEWVGRSGEVLTRGRTNVSDPYQIPPELIEPDWDLQWNTVTVVGNNEVVLAMENMMFDNGWRPVPADRPGFAKRFGVPKSGNAIIIGGLRLDERPRGMTEAAKEAEWRTANVQMRDRDVALTGGKAALRNALEGQELGMVGGYKGRRTGTRLGFDNEAPRPSYQYGTEE